MKKLKIAGTVLLGIGTVLLGLHLVMKFIFKSELLSGWSLALTDLIVLAGSTISTICIVKQNKIGCKQLEN